MRKVIGFILTAIGVFIVFLVGKAFLSIPETAKIISSAVTVEDGRLDPANEGKLVVVSGTLESSEKLQDPLTGVELPGVAARRVIWTYEQMGERDEDGYITWDWQEKYIDFTKAPYYGINAETQIPTVLIAPTTIGDFQVDNNFFSKMSFTDYFTDYNENNLNEGWYIHSKDKQAKYSISQDEKLAKAKDYYSPYEYWGTFEPTDAGAQKISYKILSPENPLEYTLVGIQKGNTLIQTPDVGSISISEGIMNAKEFAKETSDTIRGGSIFGLVIGLLFAAIGARIMFFRRDRE